MSLTSEVPAAVPSVTHSSYPLVGSKAENSALPFPVDTRELMKELPDASGLMSFNSMVEAKVPLVTQSSFPVAAV